MKSLDLFIPYVEIHCRGATEPLMLQYLRLAAQEFCQRAQIVQETFLTGTVAGDDEIAIETPSQQQFVRLHSVQWKDYLLAPTTTHDAPTNLYAPDSGDPKTAYLKSPSIGPISLYPIPDTTEADVVSVRASFAPTLTATQVADVLYTDWLEVIASGAVARLQDIPDQPFSARGPSVHLAKFERGINAAKHEAKRGRLYVSQRVKPVAFA
jgi:hypothetical protein